MSDVSAIFGILITLGIAFPGMLTAWRLLFPGTIERASQRLEMTPWACWWLGLGLTLIITIPTMILLSLPFGPAKFFGWTLASAALALSGLGAAGLVTIMGGRINRSSSNGSIVGGFVRGALC